MRQVVQSYKTGRLQRVDLPAAGPQLSRLLVRTSASLVSVGTEKYMIELAKKSLLGKALARPDLVRQVIAKAQAEGILEAWRQAMGRLDTPVPLGYSSAGVVLDVGSDVAGFVVGDRVACTGSGFAGHTEVASVPSRLCTRIPEGVNLDAAAFVAVGGIALEAVRMARISLGETVAVIGLGLLGQIAVQLLSAAGCHVVGMDVHSSKAKLALQHGAEAVAADHQSLESLCRQISYGHGVDAALIFAATPSNEPLKQAAEVCRERGRVVAAGLVGLEVPRKPFYDKELELVVSRAWGPGLYDPLYAEKGLDYPVAYGRWTAQRNMQEFLSQLARSTVRVDYLTTHRFPFDRAIEAYELILAGKEPYIGVLLTYPEQTETPGAKDRVVWLGSRATRSKARRLSSGPSHSPIGVGLIGAGQFARGTLLPSIRGLRDVQLRGVATSTGLSGRHVGEKYGFAYCTTDLRRLLDDPEISLVFVLTRHGSHAELATEALWAGKSVFVEKPLALDVAELGRVVEAHVAHAGAARLTVGFNRRFSPFTRWIKQRFAAAGEVLTVHCTVNAGAVPSQHWAHDPDEGGGRIVGEACHFVDLIQYLTGSLPVRVYAETVPIGDYKPSDNVVITLKMANGSLGSICYVAGGDKSYPRERVEIIGGGAVGVIENFKAATFTRQGRGQKIRSWLSVDRGHRGEIQALLSAIRNDGPAPVSMTEYIHTTLATFACEESLRMGHPIAVDATSVLPANPQTIS